MTTGVTPDMEHHEAYLLRVAGQPLTGLPPLDLWTGEGHITLGGVRYTGTRLGQAQALDISVVPQTEQPGLRLKVRLVVADDAPRSWWEDPPGPVACSGGWAYSDDSGRTWQEEAVGWRGFLSEYTMLDGVLTAEIETWAGEAVRPAAVSTYTHESQQALHPGDLFFEFQRELLTGARIQAPP